MLPVVEPTGAVAEPPVLVVEPTLPATARSSVASARGDVAGEVSAVLRKPALADVVAVHPAITMFRPREELSAVVREQPATLLPLYLTAVARGEAGEVLDMRGGVLQGPCGSPPTRR